MEIKNYTGQTDEDIKRLTFSRYIKISSLVDLLNGNIFVPSVETLRKADPPVIARIHDGRVLLDPRTLADEEIPLVAAAVRPPR